MGKRRPRMHGRRERPQTLADLDDEASQPSNTAHQIHDSRGIVVGNNNTQINYLGVQPAPRGPWNLRRLPRPRLAWSRYVTPTRGYWVCIPRSGCQGCPPDVRPNMCFATWTTATPGSELG